MIIKKRLIMILKTMDVATILVVPFACSGGKKDLEAGFTWEVAETTRLAGLTIAEGAAIKSLEGYSITMMVNGAVKAIKAGVYKGNIVIAVTKS